jgi:hypothetical protein
VRQTTVTCDAPGCGAELSRGPGVRILVAAEAREAANARAVFTPPSLDRDYHFCCFDCLYRWAVSHD